MLQAATGPHSATQGALLPRAYVDELAALVAERVDAARGSGSAGEAGGTSPGGDAQFGLDEIAEAAVWEHVARHDVPVLVRTEGRGARARDERPPRALLVVDPIDGTRPAVAGIDGAMVSIAVAPPDARATIGHVRAALLRDLRTAEVLYAERGRGVVAEGFGGRRVPALRTVEDLCRMRWCLELNGHPARVVAAALGDLVDGSANTGGVFVVNSASWSISRIVTGQLDAYVDVGNRLYRDHPALRPEFLRAGNGRVLHLFPYDIAAAALIAEEAGVTITDGYGRSLDSTPLLDTSDAAQRSCVAASGPRLHRSILEAIDWGTRG